VASSVDGAGNNLYTITVSGLTLHLAMGTYWLGLQPISSGSDYGYLVSTSGANAVGTPPGNDGNAFFSQSADVPGGAMSFAYASSPSDGPEDFSLGVTGSVPEPSTWALAILGLGAIFYFHRRLGRDGV
jgi:hypothetical protein